MVRAPPSAPLRCTIVIGLQGFSFCGLTRLLILADDHGVAGHLAASLRDLEKDLVPAEIRQALVDRQRARNFFTLRLTAELFRVLDRFASKGIEALVVKRAVLAMQAYGDQQCGPMAT